MERLVPRHLRIVIGLLVSTLFIVLLIRQVDRVEMSNALREIHLAWMFLALPPYLLGLALRAQRWRSILAPSLEISIRDAIELVLLGYAANNVLPVRVGDVFRATLLEQYRKHTWSLGLGTIIVERIFDGLVLSVFLAVALAIFGGGAILFSIALLATVVFTAATLVLLLLVVTPKTAATRAQWILQLTPTRVKTRLQVWLQDLLTGMTTLRSYGAWIRVTGLTTASWVFEGISYWIIGIALELPLPPLLYAGVLGAANLALAAPSTSGGIGPFEFFARESIMAHNISASVATTYAIVVHGFVLFPVMLLGLAVLWHRQLGARTLMRLHDQSSNDAP